MQGKIKIQLTETAHSSGLLKIDNESKAYSTTGFKSLDELNMKYSATQVKNPFMAVKNKEMEKSFGFDRWLIMDIPEDADVLSIVADYKKDTNVEFACPEYLLYTTATPSDPMYASQWGHNNTAQMLAWKTGDTYVHTGLPVGTVGFDARAQLGWDGSQGYGSSTVVIGIIDSGVDTAHEDINDVAGYDFGDNDTNPMDNSSQAGHGTCCAGVAAGIVNNGKGVAGVAGNCKIMPLKIANSAGSMTFTAITNAVNWGADNGAHVLSMSLGANVSPGYDTASDAAMLYAYNSGVVVLAATANNNATYIYYPSNHANVVAVGAASNSSGRKRSSSTTVNTGNFKDPNGVTVDNEGWWGSNYGVATKDAANAVDFLAPCIIPTTDITGTAGYQSGNYYTYFNGTSSACPYAAGFAALIKSRYPTYTPAQIITLMKNTCTDIVNVESVAGWDKYSGYGLINIGAALGSGTPPAAPTLLTPANGSSTSDLTPTFDWSDASGATSYTIQIDNTSNFSSPEYTNSPTVSTYTPASNLATGTWYWRVLATNSYGSSAYTTGWSVILGSAPAVPTLALPANGSTVADLTPTFDWNDVAGATSYTIQVDNNNTFASPEATSSPTTSTFTPASNLAAGTYYWRVLATNSSGSSAYCSYWSVTLTAPLPVPDVPVLLLPSNGSTVQDLTPTFDWNDAANATSYHLQIATKSNMTGLVFDSDVASSTYTPPSDMAVDLYYWRVLSINATGSSAYTATWNVNVIAPPPLPGTPTLISPANGSGTSDTTPSFDWSDAPDATGYEILIDNNSDFSSPAISTTTVTSDYTATTLALGTYYWKVRGTNATGSGGYSTSWSFSIGSPPSAPALVSPANGSYTSDLTPTFDWNDVTGSTSYTILVDNNSDFSSPEISQSPTVSTYTPGSNLVIGTYYWKVLATNNYGSGSYSTVWTANLGNPPAVPTLAAPSNGSFTSDATPDFDWNDVTGSTSYTIQIDNNSDFSSPEVTSSPAVSAFTPGSNLANGTQYWRVLATNAYGSSAYSSSWNFSIGSAPGVPTLLSPANTGLTTDQRPAFDWSDVTSATSYTILVDNNSDFSSPVISQSPTMSTYTPGSNLALGTYYWKVLATNSYGSSAYSGSWSISIGAPPSAPSLVSPSNGSTITDFTPLFDWNDISGAVSYTILVDNNSDFSAPEIIETTSVSTFTAASDLGYGTYYWKVLATNAYGDGAYSSVWNFTIPAPNISLNPVSISTTAAPDASVGESFNIGNTGGMYLTYDLSVDYIYAKADQSVTAQNFDTYLGWTASGTLVWYRSTSASSLNGTPFAMIDAGTSNASGTLTSSVFDGTMCDPLYIDFDQYAEFIASSGVVEYTLDGSNWTQIYTNAGILGAWSNPDHKSVLIPATSATMQVRFTATLKKNSVVWWAIDNINIHGTTTGPVWIAFNSATSGTVSVSGSNTIEITCDATGMSEGVYNANITVATNDPDEPVKVIPVEFTVFQSTIIPGVPSNVLTSISGNDLVIDWDIAADATSYDVFSSDDPYGTFTFETNVSTNKYTVAYTASKKFYYIKSKNATK
jgi:subtilisin family serine protease